MRKEHRVRIRTLGHFVLLCLILVAFLATGCSKATSSGTPPVKNGEQSYIMGEVIETSKASSAETAKGTLGTIDVEGSRSQEIPEALVTVTNNTKIIDEHGGKGPSATFDTLKERQTVEVLVRRSLERARLLVCHRDKSNHLSVIENRDCGSNGEERDKKCKHLTER